MKKLTSREKCILATLIAMEVRSNETNRAYDLAPVFEDEELKALYEKVTGLKWRERP